MNDVSKSDVVLNTYAILYGDAIQVIYDATSISRVKKTLLVLLDQYNLDRAFILDAVKTPQVSEAILKFAKEVGDDKLYMLRVAGSVCELLKNIASCLYETFTDVNNFNPAMLMKDVQSMYITMLVLEVWYSQFKKKLGDN